MNAAVDFAFQPSARGALEALDIPNAHRRPRILVVDDSADARLLMGAAMRKAGHEVCMASGGQQALEEARAERPDLVMLDMDMPGMSGAEVCRALRSMLGPLLPIVMVTGMDDGDSIELAYDCGATDFVPKPVNWPLMGHRVRYLLRGHRTLLELKQAESRISRLAYFDSLTGLPNRQAFLMRVDQSIAKAQEDGTQLAVLFMDLDGFKQVNDSMGHAAGDLLLQWAADRLRQGLRTNDVVARVQAHSADTMPATLDAAPDTVTSLRAEIARLGGDEFTALLHQVGSVADAMQVAQRIGKLLRRPFVIEERELTISASIGIAMFPQDGSTSAALLKHADTAMYHAKRNGRDHAEVYRASLTQQVLRRVTLEQSLRTALDLDQFHLVYQPQVDARTGQMRSAEALLRWTLAGGEAVSPGEFIGLAEELGLIVEIGQWVLRAACVQAARWAHAGLPLTVAVNLSPVQLLVPDLADQVQLTLNETGLPPGRLELELTESALMENTELTQRTLGRLRQMGVGVALDDFGTGYSSLAYLTRMPIDHLKIDRHFVNGLLTDRDNEAIVKAVVAMARSLNMHVTAEGVETPEQAQRLQEIGCDALQGFHFSHPIRADELMAGWSHRRAPS